MKKSFRRGLISLLLVSILILLTSCHESNKKDNAISYEVWSTYATTKVSQSATTNVNYVKMDSKIDVLMMRNETEGGQIIITADSDIDSFSLDKVALYSTSGDKFPVENIDVYQQKYIKVNQKSDLNGVYSIGEYVPDMLLPMDVAIEYKENSIKSGNNQGIYIEFDSEGVNDGIYTGTFTLTINNDTKEIPVTINVLDIEYTGRRSFQSAFVMYQSSLLRSEYDNSKEMTDSYIDFFLDYKINTCLHNRKRNDFSSYGQEWLEEVVRTKDNLNYNSIYIPYQFAPTYVAYSGDNITSAAMECTKYIIELAKISTPEICYIDYAYFYPFELDEADIDKQYNRAANAERMLSKGGEVDQTLSYAVSVFENDGYNELKNEYGEDFANHVKEAILQIPTLFTNVTFQEEWVDDYSSTFVPYLSLFGDGRVSEHYQESASSIGNDVWAYTCVGPSYPYPTFHLDDYNLGTRVSGWMEKCYGITGYLYWATTNDYYGSEEYKYLDPYSDGTRYNGADGDGYLCYPGSYYGLSTPIPSLRLVAFRDSMEDYDMLSVYEELLEERYMEYGLGELNFSDYVEDLYFELFNSAIYYTDDSLLFDARKKLASRILTLQNEGDVFVKETFDNSETTTTVYSTLPTLSINGKDVEGEMIGDGIYSYAVNDDGRSVVVTINGSEYNFERQTVSYVSVNSSNVKVSDKSAYEINDNVVNATLRSKMFNTIDSLQTLNFTPSVSFKMGKDTKAKNVCATIKNNSDFDTDVYVRVIVDGMVFELGSTFVKSGQSKSVRFNLIEGLTLSSDGEIQFYVTNIFKNEIDEYELQNDVSLEFSNIRLEYAKGE